jgi:hypothetical protein
MNGTQRRMPARTAANDRRWSAMLRRQERIQRCPYVRKCVIAKTNVNKIVLNIRVFILFMQENNPMQIIFVILIRHALPFTRQRCDGRRNSQLVSPTKIAPQLQGDFRYSCGSDFSYQRFPR